MEATSVSGDELPDGTKSLCLPSATLQSLSARRLIQIGLMGLVERGVEVDRLRWENPQACPIAEQGEEVSQRLPANAVRDAEVWL